MVAFETSTDEWLSALGDQLASAHAEIQELVVCGGSALQVLGLIDRLTRDVDILALMAHDSDGRPLLRSASVLPETLVRAAGIVEKDFRLPRDWINPGPTNLLLSLPDGLADRLVARRYGPVLVVHFISRFDQIHFKMYAAMNSCEERHLDDLRRLMPSDGELIASANWCLKQDASEVFPKLMKDFLEKVGYADVADRMDI